MDVSTFALPLRKDRAPSSFFSARPSITSVNVSYETVEGNSRSTIDNESPLNSESRSTHGSTTPPAGSSPATSITSPPGSLVGTPAGSPVTSRAGSPTLSTHEFPYKQNSPQKDQRSNSANTNKASPSRRRRARSSFSVASAECQSFVQSLKEPKYAKPLTADEIAWIFQDFYLKLRAEILGSADEMLTKEELAERKQAELDIDVILDKAERVVTGGELFTKLFTLGENHDVLLQPRIDAIRQNSELLDALSNRLEISDFSAAATLNGQTSSSNGRSHRNGSSINGSGGSHSGHSDDGRSSTHGDDEELGLAIQYLNRLNRETSPKAKLALLTKAHHAIAESLPKKSGDADTIFPLFVLCLTKSTAVDWWQNFMFIQRFRRSSELVGQAAYCLTNFEAAIHVLEQFTTDKVPAGVDPSIFARPIYNPRAPRQRSSSQSSKDSSNNSATATASFSQRLGETLNSYRSILASARKPQTMHQHPVYIEQRFLTAEADSLTMGDVKTLLKEYKRLADYIENKRPLSFAADGKTP